MYKNDALVRPRYAETDQMGVIYHGNYYAWFEVGRSDFFRSLGYTYKRLEEEGIILPVVESSCKYIKPAMYDEEVLIRTFVEMQKAFELDLSMRSCEKKMKPYLQRGGHFMPLWEKT